MFPDPQRVLTVGYPLTTTSCLQRLTLLAIRNLGEARLIQSGLETQGGSPENDSSCCNASTVRLQQEEDHPDRRSTVQKLTVTCRHVMANQDYENLRSESYADVEAGYYKLAI